MNKAKNPKMADDKHIVWESKGDLSERSLSKIFDKALFASFLKRNATKAPVSIEQLVGSKARSSVVTASIPGKANLTIFQRQLLGEGAFGSVRRGRLQTISQQGLTHIDVAVKVTRNKDANSSSSDMLKDECKAMIRCRDHWNVIELIFVVSHPKKETLMGLELAENGALCDHLTRKHTHEQRWAWFYQVSSAIHYCHTRGVAHLDIKPENVLLDKSFNAKIADFGLAKVISKTKHFKDKDFEIDDQRGTTEYMAPEMFYERRYDSRKCDVWSLGVLLYELFSNTVPFPERDIDKITEMRDKERINFVKHVYDTRRLSMKKVPREASLLVKKILKLKPLERPTMQNITTLVEKIVMKGPEVKVAQTVKGPGGQRKRKPSPSPGQRSLQLQRKRVRRSRATSRIHRPRYESGDPSGGRTVARSRTLKRRRARVESGDRKRKKT